MAKFYIFSIQSLKTLEGERVVDDEELWIQGLARNISGTLGN